MEIRLLGQLEVMADDGPVALGGGRHRALLAVLALHPNEVVSSDRLVEALWGPTPPSTAHKSLRNLVSRLRKALNSHDDGLIETRSPGYVLVVEDDAIDIRRFEQLAAEGHSHVDSDPRRAAETLREALRLWQGEALAEFRYESFAQEEIARLAERRLGATEDRIDAELALGRHEPIVAELRGLVAANPLRERLRGRLMLALYRSGRQADALATYREARQLLDRELGLEPGDALRTLEQAILNHDPELGPSRRMPRFPSSRSRRLAVLGLAVLLAAGGIALAAVVARDDAPPVVVPDSLVKIDVETNRIVDVVPVGRDPGQVELVGPYVLVTSQADKTLHRLEPASGELKTTGAYASDGALAAAGPFVWATSVSRAELVRIHAETLRGGQRVPLRRDQSHAFVAVGGGSLWIVENAPPAVSRVRLRTLALERRYPLGPYEFPVEVTFAAGAAWIALGSTSELLRIDGRTGASRRIQVGSSASDPAFGFGSIWAGSVDERAVWRVDAFSDRTTAVVPTGRVGFGLATGAGSVWVSNYCDGTVSRIDPETNRVVTTIQTGYFPKWLAVGNGFAWVGVSGTDLDFPSCA